MAKPAAQLDREIAETLARSRRSHATIGSTTDVTEEVLRDSSYGPGEYTTRVARAKPARDQTPQLIELLAEWERRYDKTMGSVSKPLAYSKAMPTSKRDHTNLIRLIKGGHLRVFEVGGPPPGGTVAERDSPYGTRYYVIASPGSY